LEVAAHLEHAVGFAAFHHRALDRGEPVGEHADDQVVEHVGLGFDRSAAVVLAHERDDPVGDLGQQPATDERPHGAIVGPAVGHRRPRPALLSVLLTVRVLRRLSLCA
jgi:hypothetical protein